MDANTLLAALVQAQQNNATASLAGAGAAGLGGTPLLGQPALSQPALGQLGLAAPGLGQQGLAATGLGQPGLGAPGLGQAGLGAAALGQPGLGTPNIGQLPGLGALGLGGLSTAPGLGALGAGGLSNTTGLLAALGSQAGAAPGVPASGALGQAGALQAVALQRLAAASALARQAQAQQAQQISAMSSALGGPLGAGANAQAQQLAALTGALGAQPTVGALGALPGASNVAGLGGGSTLAALIAAGSQNTGGQNAAMSPLASPTEAAVVVPEVVPAGQPVSVPAQVNTSTSNASEKEKDSTSKEESEKENDSKPKEEVRRCHLHKKPNAKCKFCQAQAAEMQKLEEDAREKKKQDEAKTQVRNGLREELEAKNNFSARLKDQILKSQYCRYLHTINKFEDLINEIETHTDSIDIYERGSATMPSKFICCVYRLFGLELKAAELRQLLYYDQDQYVRCAGFLFIRIGLSPDQLWPELHEFLLDTAELPLVREGPNVQVTTIGAYVESLFLDDKYFGSPLPRIPIPMQRTLEERLAPFPQCRKRAQANSRKEVLDLFRTSGTPIEACLNGDWIYGHTMELLEDVPSLLRVRVRLDDGSEERISIGKVVFRGADSDKRRRGRSRSRSRGRSPDWSRQKGKSDAELVEELRQKLKDRSVVTHGKEYASKTTHFDAGLALRREQGKACTHLLEEEAREVNLTQRSSKKRESVEELEERMHREKMKNKLSEELQREKQKIFEKYSASRSASVASTTGSSEVEAPEMMRLG